MGTDELDERIELLYQSGFCDEAGRDGLRRAVDALEVRSSPAYAEAKRIRDELIDALGFELPEAEKDFVLVHVGGLLLLQANE